MIVLGVDPGFSVTGWAIISKQGNTQVLLAHGFLPLPTKKELHDRIGIFYEFFAQKIKMYAVTHLALETPFLGKNAQTFLKLGYLRGVVCLMAYQNNLILHEFSPREVKRAITGFGGAQKDQVARVLQMLFPGLPQPKTYDVTDAVAVSLCGVWHRPIIL
ncbi:MAG TPA: crossover junction endodeoxyribonuclease RuvC [Candidatus Saccharimonadales bacterium]|nr:crossover junction endodeoxyribonuclease RuvC [Candidatus Saccharimonadales bacterium]